MNSNQQELSASAKFQIKQQIKLFNAKNSNTKSTKKDNRNSKFMDFYFSNKYKL